MARCKSVDVMRQIILDTKIEKMETEWKNGDSDSDSDISCILELDMNGKKEGNGRLVIQTPSSDSNPDSPKNVDNEEMIHAGSECVYNKEQINVAPVFSVQCLHDSTNEDNETSENSSKFIEFIDACDVPELSIKSIGDEKKNLNHISEDDDEEEEEHPYLVPVAQNHSSSVSYPSITHPSSSIPARNDWDGVYNFKISICCEGPRRTESTVFLETQNKLYVSKDSPFKVLVSADNVPMGSMIRATAVFSMVEHSYQIVRRCPTHAQQDFVRGLAEYEHFVQCFSDMSVYEKSHDSGRLSVSVPYEKPNEGENFSAYLFKLTCFSSCSGGINRRRFMLIFTLEKDNIPLGRQTLEAKVCACPMRDYKADEERAAKHASRRNSKDSSHSRPSNPEKIKYSIAVKDPELYLFLKQMKSLYEASVYTSKYISDT